MWWKSLDSFRLHRVRTKAIRFRICHFAKAAKSSDHPCPHLTLFIGFLIDLYTGRHSAENIRQAVSSILDEYQISDKVHVIVSDNASNMVKAFSVGFSADDEKMVDEEEMWVSGFIVFFFHTALLRSSWICTLLGMFVSSQRRCRDHWNDSILGSATTVHGSWVLN